MLETHSLKMCASEITKYWLNLHVFRWKIKTKKNNIKFAFLIRNSFGVSFKPDYRSMFVQLIQNFRPSNLLIAKFMTNWTEIRFRFVDSTKKTELNRCASMRIFLYQRTKKGKLFLNELKSSHLHEEDEKLFVCRSSILRCCLRNRISFDNRKCSVLKIHFDSESSKSIQGKIGFRLLLRIVKKLWAKNGAFHVWSDWLFLWIIKSSLENLFHIVSMAILIF